MTTLCARAYSFSEGLAHYTEQVLDAIKDPYTVGVKTLRCAQAIQKLFEGVITSVVFKAACASLDTIKIFHIPLFAVRSYHAFCSMKNSEGVALFLTKTAKFYGSLKKISTGFASVVYCLKDRITFPKQIFSTITFFRYVFIPNTTVEALVSGYKSVKLVQFYLTKPAFMQRVSTCQDVDSISASLVGRKDELRRLKVCTEKNSLEAKIEKIKLMSDDIKVDAANKVFGELKSRLQHQITHKAVRTCVKVFSLFVTIIGCTTISMPILASLELALATSRLATFLYGRCSA